MNDFELDIKPRHVPREHKKRATKIEEYNLELRVVNYIALNKSYPYIARKLREYVKNRKNNPDPNFEISGQTVKMWWMSNSSKYNELVNEKRSAIITQRSHRYLDKGIKVREKIQRALESDAREAANKAETAYDFEAAARIREKIVKVQESGEKAIATQTPNINVTNIQVNPLVNFTEKMKKKLNEIEEEEANTIDVEYEDIDEEDTDEEDIDEEDDEAGDDEEDSEE